MSGVKRNHSRLKRCNLGTLENPCQCSTAEFLASYYPRSTNFSVIDTEGTLRVSGLSQRQAARQASTFPDLLIKVSMRDTFDIIKIGETDNGKERSDETPN